MVEYHSLFMVVIDCGRYNNHTSVTSAAAIVNAVYECYALCNIEPMLSVVSFTSIPVFFCYFLCCVYE